MKEVGGANLQGFREDIDEYTEIRNTIAEIVSTLKDMNTLTADLHSDADFEALRNAIDERMQRDGQSVISPPIAIPEPEPPVIPTISPNSNQEQYLAKVREFIVDGKISIINRHTLNDLSEDLELNHEEVKKLEAIAFEPWTRLQKNLKRYEQTLIAVLEQEYPLSEASKQDLKHRQAVLGLGDRDIAVIEYRLFSQKELEIQKQRELEAEKRRQETLKQQEQTRENLWQQVKQQMHGIYQDSAQKYRIDYNPPLWEQLNALPDDLRSEKSIDYKPLCDLLKAKEWQEADQETYRVMLRVANRESQGWLDRESIDNFPCADLRTIDQLWVKYSQGHFGFSIQKQIWLKCGGKVDYETEKKLGDALGWRENGSWEFNMIYDSSTSILAHLPAGVVYVMGFVGDVLVVIGWVDLLGCGFFSRAECNNL